MKIVTIYRYWLLTMLAMLSVSAWAQKRNVLSVPDAKVAIGQAQLPVAIENTDEIVAAQFDLTLPSTISAGTDGVLTNRCDGHTVIIRKMEATRYRVMLYSDVNRPLLAQQGTVLYVPLVIPQTVVEGSELPLVISNATLTVASGENVLTDTKAGKLIVSLLPDLTVSTVTAHPSAQGESSNGTAASQSGESPSITPGERLSLSWVVQNVGGSPTTGGWSEQLLLVNKRGTVTKLMATTYCQETLEPGAKAIRQADITVPQLPGIEGEAYVQVHIIANSQTGESALATANNTARSAELYNVGKRLFIEPTPARIDENHYSQRVMVKVSRSGDWNSEQTFNLTATADSRIALPAAVTIPVGQSGATVYMTLADNDVLDADSIVTITATGNDYPDAAGRLIIDDNEYPDLTLTASKSEITEGGTFLLTVSTSRPSAYPVTVTLSSENTKRFTFPQTLTIPAGETSATAEVTATDDELPSRALSNAFTASAPKHNKAEAIVLLRDNDLPVLTLTLTPDKVQESVGVVAVAGTLRRTTNTNSRITVRLTDDADGGLYFGNRTLVLNKGVEEIHFNFGPVDNALMEGERTYNITASVWLSSCNCDATGEAAGSVTAQLTVLDNDGAALNITSSLSTVKEGGKTTLTVTRNTRESAQGGLTALTVTLSSNYEEGLTYDHTVTIPAGKQSATVEVTSAANSVQGDSHTVIFTVQAEGYAKGTCYLMVTDQTLPDARISSIAAVSVLDGSPVESLEVGDRVKLTITVNNDGAAELPAGVSVKIFRRGDSNAIATILTTETIDVGGSLTLSKTITLPDYVGTHSYYAVVNQGHQVQELAYNNNTSADVSINTKSPFAITLNTDKTLYKQGDRVTVTGQLNGNSTANAEVDVYLINEGARQVQTVTTDAQGAFTCEWQLYPLQSGHFTVGACYPGEGLTTEMAAFNVYGLRLTSYGYVTCEVKLGEPHTGTIAVQNPGVLPQTIAAYSVVSKPEGCEVALEAPETIGANETVRLKYQFTGTRLTEGDDWEQIELKVVTKEGIELPFTIYYFCAPHHAVLTASTTSIKTTMTKGASREYQLNIMNTGKGATGKIRVALPNVDWMRLSTPTEMPSLEYGESATIILNMTPTSDMQLNVPQKGKLAINCDNGQGIVVSYNVEPVSEATGVLNIDVVDEYTYYTDEQPHVAGAGVVVKHPVTGAIVAQGTTGADGIFSVELPEGYYSVTVSESHHSSVSGNVLVDPGTTNTQEVFLSYTAITYSWDVVETEIEDEYKIETVVKYETNVPKPVVIVSLPTERPAEGSVVPVVVTNKGLINAQHLEMSLECTEGYSLELLNPERLEVLAPQQSYVFYARFTRDATADSRRKAPGDPEHDCISILAGALYDYICGNAENFDEALAQNGWGHCSGDGGPGRPSKWHIKPVPHTGPTLPTWAPIWPHRKWEPDTNHNGPSSDGTNPLEQLRQWYCKLPCGKELTQALACEAASKIIPDWLSCPYDVYNGCLSSGRSASSCAESILGCTPPGGHINCWRPYIECMYKHYHNNSRSFKASAAVTDTNEAIAGNYLAGSALLDRESDAFWRIIGEHFGDDAWMDFDNKELADMLGMVASLGEDHVFTAADFSMVRPSQAPDALVERFVERLNNTFQHDSYEGMTNYINPDTLAYYAARIQECEQEAKEAGWNSVAEMYTDSYNGIKEIVSEGSSSVCASVTIKLSQTMVMTRQAFRGTLTVTNGNESTAMAGVKLSLDVTDPDGNQATAREFEIRTESLEGFAGELDLGSGWELAANTTGTATILFIPSRYAAPDEPLEWAFGGTLSYVDPFTGLEVTRELYPVTLTVKPSPVLDLTYFMQRDLYGDDPLTLDVVEPTVPGEFALLINNKGNGDATNVRMVTWQPEIIDNEKGLHIKFEIVSSAVNGGDTAPAFSKTVANDFGTIPAHSQLYAQWWLTSSLLGHFTEYKVEATHVTSYGNEDLSLLDQVTIHELIHGFTPPANSVSDGFPVGRAFLVNDIPDVNDQPDKLYFSNGDTATVAQAATARIERKSSTKYELTVTPSAAGWNYGSLLDPTYGNAEIRSIVRKSDGQDLGNTCFWMTDRTLRDGKDWLYEHRLHFIDMFADGTAQTYVITFDPIPEVVLAVENIGTLPAEGVIVEESIDQLTVTFNKKIDATTFTADDLTFAVQGVRMDASQIAISTEDNKSFTLDLSAMNDTLANGYYTMTVQTADITDAEGYKGKNGKQVSWILFRNGQVRLGMSVWPANAGSISHQAATQPLSAISHQPSAIRAASADASPAKNNQLPYGSEAVFTATPNEGYRFLNWTLNGETVSAEPTYTVTALSDMDIVANFAHLPVKIQVDDNSQGGMIAGSGTGIYDYHSELTITALPDADFILRSWIVNGKPIDSNATTLVVRADSAMTIQAVFVRDIYTQTTTCARGWNWVSSYLLESQSLGNMTRYANRVLDQQSELFRDPQFGLVGGISQIEPGKAYKVEAYITFTTNFRGHIYGDDTKLAVEQGWNWMAYPYYEAKPLSSVITNAEEGDYITSQTGLAEFSEGTWEGSIADLTPGHGYLYKSASQKQLSFDFTEAAGSRMANYPLSTVHYPLSAAVDPHRYPSTMNITARIYRDGVELPGSQYTVYAYAGDELRGVSQFVGQNHYLTVYGDEPVNISFIVESAETGETFAAAETLTFVSDVVGSRKNPYAVSISTTTGISQQMADQPMTIYTLDGILVSRDATIRTLHTLPKGVYIVNGRKTAVK